MEDVDGDGRLTMRIPDPHGACKKCTQQMRVRWCRASPASSAAKVLPADARGHAEELGRLHRQGQSRRRRPGPEPQLPGLLAARNSSRSAPAPTPTSEPEVRAMVEFVIAHPNIGAGISYHTHSGVILRPMGTCSDDDMIPEDLWSYQRFSNLGEQLTGYPAMSIWHEFKYHPKEVIGGTQDWLYEHLGALFWWRSGRQTRPPTSAATSGSTGSASTRSRTTKLLEVERRAVRRPGARRLAAVPAPAARRGGDRRLGQDELLAQPAAAPARARGGALPGLMTQLALRFPSSNCCAPRCARSAPTPGACAWRCQQRLAAGLRQPARAAAQRWCAAWSSRSRCRRAIRPSRWSRARSASKARSSKAMRPSSRRSPSCPAAKSPPTAPWPSGSRAPEGHAPAR